jgi:outer membrane receptor for ferrienterochelin and colicins
MRLFTLLAFLLLPVLLSAQFHVSGVVTGGGKPLDKLTIRLQPGNRKTLTDSAGRFRFTVPGGGWYTLRIDAVGYEHYHQAVAVEKDSTVFVTAVLRPVVQALDDVVVSGTLRAVSKSESPVPIEVYNRQFFQKNPTATLFEAVSLINGVQPQVNCNVCNTGDIHINGMEGPYTLVLIDGMPIVSGLSSVYGLSGIPSSLIERVEVVKGPAASLYGSDAMGGTINVITKSPAHAPRVSADVFGTTYGEYNADVAFKTGTAKVSALTGISYFNYQNRIDRNNDGFTDVTLQNRIAVFSKWSFTRRKQRSAALSVRYVYEDRWGGQTNWSKQWRGGDSIYGESIYTARWEMIGLYQLPVTLPVFLQVSYNSHNQNSFYGTTPFMGIQRIGFAQLYTTHAAGAHHLLAGIASRYTYYDDNTTATRLLNGTNQPQKTWLPGLFLQDEVKLGSAHVLLAGYRLDYDRVHGAIQSPRIAYKYAPDQRHVLRASFGTGFRVVNVFTEDHAALTGAREVVFRSELKPERSVNTNLNYVHKLQAGRARITLDATAFYTYFSNKIIANYEDDPNYIYYDNLKGYAVSRGFALNAECSTGGPLNLAAGFTLMDVFRQADGERQRQLFAPAFTGNFLLGYRLPGNWTFDLTGKANGPMRLPILPNDYRPEYSPWFCIANVQCRKTIRQFEVYGGLKNLLNFVPRDPIMRAGDPFDKQAADPVQNPNGYTFDPSYNYAPLQGIRGFLGMRYHL